MFDKVYVQSVSWLRSQVWVSWVSLCRLHACLCYKCLVHFHFKRIHDWIYNFANVEATTIWLGANSIWLGANSIWLGANSIKFSRSGGKLGGGKLVMGRNRYKSWNGVPIESQLKGLWVRAKIMPNIIVLCPNTHIHTWEIIGGIFKGFAFCKFHFVPVCLAVLPHIFYTNNTTV